MAAGKHEFRGSCDPKASGRNSGHTFSVGVFEWIPKSSGKGLKRSAVKVRVKGSMSKPAAVYEKATQICAALDAGMYTGPKNITVWPKKEK